MEDENRPGIPLWDFLYLVARADVAHEAGDRRTIDQVNAALAVIGYRVTWDGKRLKVECEESHDGQR